MTATIVSSVAHRRRLERASAWLQGRGQSEELLVVGATLDGANELARTIARGKGVTFGWHRLGVSQLAFAIATPALAERGLAPLSSVGTEAIVARIAHQMTAVGRLTQYATAATAPGFPHAVTRVVSELRAARVRPNVLKDVASDLAQPRHRAP
jgi:hypothetical protein